MSALTSLTDLEKIIGDLTGEEASQLRAWRQTIKTHSAYASLRRNIAFRDVMTKLAEWTKNAHEKINDKDTKESDRRDQFLVRDLGLFMLGLFDESEEVLDNLDRHLMSKIEEWKKYR